MFTLLWHYPLTPVYSAPRFHPGNASALQMQVQARHRGYGRHPAPARLSAAYLHSTFYPDFYERFHVSARQLALGNLIGEQRRELRLWNSYRRSRILQSLTLIHGEGLVVTGPPSPPTPFLPLQERTYTVVISPEGPSILRATMQFTFDGAQTLALPVTGTRIVSWCWPPDWGNPVQERLTWLTELLPSRTGVTQRRKLRRWPRRAFEFSVRVHAQDRRTLDSALFDWSSLRWALPIFPHVSRLDRPVIAGAYVIETDTTGREFQTGGLAMLWYDARHSEVIQIADIRPDRIVLTHPLLSHWPRGTRLYPARSAHLHAAPEHTYWHDDAGSVRVVFELDEPGEATADIPATHYRGYPVFDWRPDRSQDPIARYVRLSHVLDEHTGLTSVLDRPNRPYRGDTLHFLLDGRTQRDMGRRWLYRLAGRYRYVWLPSGTHDVHLVQPASAADTALVIQWSGYTRFARTQPNRRDLRIELRDGSIFFRRIIGYGELDAEREQLTIDAPLDQRLDPGNVRLISFMTRTALAHDDVVIDHLTDLDGLARVTLEFSGEPDEH
ncbi:MAG: hypothetical protein LBV45_02065 [Xanthomonadaceae bacterium]|jgi:hypothetical protein|nr:hypothetical protein [Xanthomonadaceae bacterium]